MNCPDADNEDLLRRAADGEATAVDALFARHRVPSGTNGLRTQDPRLRARVDPSDVVQETFAAASRKLPQYMTNRPIAFYPWLRQIAWEQLVHLHDRHLRAARRSVTREGLAGLLVSDQSSMALADRLIGALTSPSQHAIRQELQERVRDALGQLSETDQEVLAQRYMEQLTSQEIAAGLGISENAVNLRHIRALERLRKTLFHRPRAGIAP